MGEVLNHKRASQWEDKGTYKEPKDTDNVRVPRLEVDDATTYIDKDVSDNMTLTDTVTGTKTLAQLSAAGGGDVTGPALSTDNEIARQHSTTGKILQTYTSNPPTISDTGDVNIDGDLDVENIVVSGNVDGRDVSADGVKLDYLNLSNDGTKTTIAGKSGDYNRIGDAGVTDHSLNSEHDLLITGELEVDGDAAFDGPTITFGINTNVHILGKITLAENAPIVLDSALSADGKYSGIVEAGTAGATLAFGDLVYLAVADSRWELAKADAIATSIHKIGICVLAAANDGNATTILLVGKVRADTAFPALTVAAPVYISAGTAGDITSTIPTKATGHVVRVIGQANTADELWFNPDNDWLVYA